MLEELLQPRLREARTSSQPWIKRRTHLLSASLLLITLPQPAQAQIQAQAPAQAQATAGRPNFVGNVWVVNQTTRMRELTVPVGKAIAAPPGKTVSLTVDGVGSKIAPGVFRGNVVLSVVDDIPVKYKGLEPHQFRSALYVQDSRPIPSKSVSAAVIAGKAEVGRATGLIIRSNDERFNGVIVAGHGKYVIDNPTIELTGNGGNDFAGYGAGIMSTGKSDVVVNNAKIRTVGAVRPAIFIGQDSTMRLNGADIEVRNGVLPPDYKFTVELGKMMEVPWMLGLSGNVRATNLVDSGTLYISNSRIRAQGWGALSTDDTISTRMFVKDSQVDVTESGYGAYSIGKSHDHFSNTKINAADIGAIMAAGGSVTFTDGSTVNAGRFGVMMHMGIGGGTLTVDKGSAIAAKETAIQVKGLGTTVIVNDAKVTAGNGIILQGMENDDPFLKAVMEGRAPEMGAPPPGLGPNGPKEAGPPPSPDIIANFTNMTLDGDFLNGRTSQGAMVLTFAETKVTGAMSTSTVRHATGKEPTRDTYKEIGNVVNILSPTNTKNGLDVTLSKNASWTVTRTSYLNSLNIDDSSKVMAPAGRALTMTIDGRRVQVRPGRYKGAITLKVS